MIDCNKCIVQNCIFNSTTPKKSCQWYKEKKAEDNSFFNFDKVIEIECNKARADERKRIIKELEELRKATDVEFLHGYCQTTISKAIEVVKGDKNEVN